MSSRASKSDGVLRLPCRSWWTFFHSRISVSTRRKSRGSLWRLQCAIMTLPRRPSSCVFIPFLCSPVVTVFPLLVTCTQIKGVYTSVAMMGFLHLYLKYTQPLFVQAVMAFKSLYEAKIVKIHVLGQNADGDLKRPFKTGPGLFGGACTPPAAAVS